MLEQILETKKEEVLTLTAERPDLLVPKNLSTEGEKTDGNSTESFIERLRQPNRTSALIAEVKKASPSKGVIREDFDPVMIAKSYEKAGADCLSVLTDQHYFQGDPQYISAIKEQVQLPVLRKDFIISPIQINESVEMGADAILLIAKALPPQDLKFLYDEATHAGLDCLVEVHNRQELEQLLEVFTPRIIGVNNRNLDTFETDINVTKSLSNMIPKGVTMISESGIHGPDMIQALERVGVHGFLVGEYLMRQKKIEEAVSQLYG
ncbi:indole-3-glycerol phosphate synthase TrpC [Caldalkalibacillus salinus]|uniref:indole-3-glycerol phosphate synthase TrpC n=1 Tax=Caldalkalibacillus salinus TaxID=2803787 RepID=UPI0019246ADD|nr:indole-3-glycerol phosphate synthase TrpC [Caldalkalibacillus salinus]